MSFPAPPCRVCSGPQLVVVVHQTGCPGCFGPCAGLDFACPRCSAKARDAGAAKDGKTPASEIARVRAVRNLELAARRRAQQREAM